MDLPRRLLVVDDDDVSIKAMRDMLLMYDFEVDDLSDSTKVIPHLHETNNYGLYIIDVNMPGKDGITLASQIRNTFRATTPILFVSGDISDETANRIRRLKLSGYVDFLKKGEFDSRKLFNHCMAMLKDHAAAKTMQELTGRLSHLQENFTEGMSKITEFISDFKHKPLVTEEHCDKKAESIAKALRKEIIGITMRETAKKVDQRFEDDVQPTVHKLALFHKDVDSIKTKVTGLENAPIPAPEPEAVAVAMEKSLAFRVLKWAIILIASGYGSWLGFTHLLATENKQGVTEIKIEHKHLYEAVRQQTTNIKEMRALLQSIPRTRHSTL